MLLVTRRGHCRESKQKKVVIEHFVTFEISSIEMFL